MHGFSATFFTSPLEALAAARAKSPDLLISDVDMPSISGIELAIRMKALHPTCQIMLFSGQPSAFDLLNSARAQGHDFDLLLKPVPPPAMLAEIRKRIRSAGYVRPDSQAKVDESRGFMTSSGVQPQSSRSGDSRCANHKLD